MYTHTHIYIYRYIHNLLNAPEWQLRWGMQWRTTGPLVFYRFQPASFQALNEVNQSASEMGAMKMPVEPGEESADCEVQ